MVWLDAAVDDSEAVELQLNRWKILDRVALTVFFSLSCSGAALNSAQAAPPPPPPSPKRGPHSLKV